MLVTRALVERLETVEVATLARLVEAMARLATDPVPEARSFGSGLLVATGSQRYVNRAVGVSLDELGPAQVDELSAWFGERGLVPAVQLSPWAPETTVTALADAGFGTAWCRSVWALDTTGPTAQVILPDLRAVRVVEVTDDRLARASTEVMTAEHDDTTTPAGFMAADLASEGTTQLVALVDGRAVGCGSITVVGRTAWLGAAATVRSAQGRGVQTALLAERVQRARAQGCDLVGATASVGSVSARNLQRQGFGLVQDQWVVEQRVGATCG